jgi:hypothetical protein
MTESEVCADSGGLIGLKLVDSPSPMEAGSEGTVIENISEKQLVKEKGDINPVSEMVRYRVQH